MVEPLYIKAASYVIFIHAKFNNYSRTELLFSKSLEWIFFYFGKEANMSKAILDKNEDRKQISLSNNKFTGIWELLSGSFKGKQL